MQGRLHILREGRGWRVAPPPPLALAALLAGRTPEDAATLLPRLFNLCGAAQGLAARLSLGLAPAPGAEAALAREVLRDHLLALCLVLPAAAGLPGRPLPAGWQADADVAPQLWGGEAPARLGPWLASGAGLAPLLARLDERFGPAQGRASPLPLAGADSMDQPQPLENSPAGRHASHPLMRQAEARAGRGPLWRALGRLLDAVAAARGDLPAPVLRADGLAVVPAARGLYALRLGLAEGRIAQVARITPTDHMLAPGGTLGAALATLSTPALAPLLVALHDPCLPVTLRGTAPEAAHA